MQIEHCFVLAIDRHQFIVRTLLNDLPLLNYSDRVSVSDRRESMSDDDGCSTTAGIIDCLLHDERHAHHIDIPVRSSRSRCQGQRWLRPATESSGFQSRLLRWRCAVVGHHSTEIRDRPPMCRSQRGSWKQTRAHWPKSMRRRAHYMITIFAASITSDIVAPVFPIAIF